MAAAQGGAAAASMPLTTAVPTLASERRGSGRISEVSAASLDHGDGQNESQLRLVPPGAVPCTSRSPLCDSDSSDGGAFDSDFDSEEQADEIRRDKDRRISAMVNLAETRGEQHGLFYGHLLLALSVGFWVTLFAMPIYVVELNLLIFGQRGMVVTQRLQYLNTTASENGTAAELEKVASDDGDTANLSVQIAQLHMSCASTDIGKMRNSAPPGDVPKLVAWIPRMTPVWDKDTNPTDIWCGYVPRTYVDNWPNVGQFILFTVFVKTGTTVNYAVQGLTGTVMAVANMHVMTNMFPFGARGHLCGRTADGKPRDAFVVIWGYRGAGWRVRYVRTHEDAVRAYQEADNRGGLRGRAIWRADGSLDKTHHWYSHGMGPKFRQKYNSLVQEDCTPNTIVYDDPNYARYGELASLVNVAMVLLLFLLSKSAKNTIMFGMSWHVYFMMNFMNPTLGVEHDAYATDTTWWFTEYFVVEVTTLAGAIIAIICTLVPGAKLNNLHQLFHDAMMLTQSIDWIWKHSVAYLSGDEKSAARFQIETRVDAMESLCSQIQANIDGAWWENFDLGGMGKKRRLLAKYDASLIDIKDMLYVVKTCVLTESFDGQHAEFWDHMRTPVMQLTEATTDLMWLSLQSCKDGHIDSWEVAQMRAQAAHTLERQSELMAAFHLASPAVCQSLSEENTFVFAVAYWARKVTDFAGQVVDSAEGGTLHRHTWIWQVAVEAVRRTWVPSEIFEPDHLKFTFRNLLSILVAFLMGYYMSESIFQRYNPTMAVTLTLLFVSDGSHHVEYEKCTHRLLGVALGKTLPIIITGLLVYLPCGSWGRSALQGLLTWIFCFMWTFLYYNSDMWSYVGVLIGGFGIYGLMTPCSGQQDTDIMVAKYREIGNVMVAIFVQAILHTMLSRHSPRNLITKRFRDLGGALKDGFEAVFAADLPALQAAIADASVQLARAKTLAPECNPKLQLLRGRNYPFKVDFCNSLLTHLELLVCELRMLELVARDWVASGGGGTGSRMRARSRTVSTVTAVSDCADPDDDEPKSIGVLELLCQRPSMQAVEGQLLPSVWLVSEVMPDMLEDTKQNLSHCSLRDPSAVRASGTLDAAHSLYDELAHASLCFTHDRSQLTNDVRVRMTIAVRALEHAAFHLCKMEERCIKEATL